MDIRAQKDLVRRSVAERMARMTEQDRQAESRSICRRILEHLPNDVTTVAAYYPMKTEVDIVPLLEEFLQKGIAIYLPRTEGKSFQFRKINSLKNLEPGPFRILEPTVDDDVFDVHTPILALVPGCAFDGAGNRLGRGNGGYDRWLADIRKQGTACTAWGICFDAQMINTVPMEAHDQPLDAIVTPRGLRIINPQA